MSDGQRILNEIGQNAYRKPLVDIRSQPDWPTLSNPLHVILLILDFDIEVDINGLFGFLENSSGRWLDETAAAFLSVGADSTAELLTRVRAQMIESDVTFSGLRDPNVRGVEYEVSTFSQRHGSKLDEFADAIRRIEDCLYADESDQSPLQRIESFAEQHVDEIQSELNRFTASR